MNYVGVSYLIESSIANLSYALTKTQETIYRPIWFQCVTINNPLCDGDRRFLSITAVTLAKLAYML